MNTTDIPILETRITAPLAIQPVHNFILIQKLDDETNIIQLPDGVTNPFQQWVVLEVSKETTCVKRGDNILLIPDAPIIKIDDQRTIGMVHDNAVVGIVS